MGLANTCHDYVPDYAVITGPLRELTKKNHIFNWNNSHRRAFEQVKKKLTQAPIMAYFDTVKRSLLIVDGSPLGICAILAQRDKSTEVYIGLYHMLAEPELQLKVDIRKQISKG